MMQMYLKSGTFVRTSVDTMEARCASVANVV